MFFNNLIKISAPTDDEQSDLSAMSSATPSSLLYGNRFFGPDFNIDQLRCKLKQSKINYSRNFKFFFVISRLRQRSSRRWRQRPISKNPEDSIATFNSQRCKWERTQEDPRATTTTCYAAVPGARNVSINSVDQQFSSEFWKFSQGAVHKKCRWKKGVQKIKSTWNIRINRWNKCWTIQNIL